MVLSDDLEKKCEFLGWNGTGPKALINLLAQRPSWREDKLEEAYYKNTSDTFRAGPSNFRTLILKLLEYGLAREKKTPTGFRFKLNKPIWDMSIEEFNGINAVVNFYHSGSEKLRADCNLNTFLKRVFETCDKLGKGEASRTKIYAIAATIITGLRDYNSDNSIAKYRFTKRGPDEIKNGKRRVIVPSQSDLPLKVEAAATNGAMSVSSTDALLADQLNRHEEQTTDRLSGTHNLEPGTLLTAETGHLEDTPAGLPVGCLRLITPLDFWPQINSHLRKEMLHPEVFADRNAIIFDITITATRKQKVMLAVTEDRGIQKFLIFSLCGTAESASDIGGVLKSTGIQHDGKQVTSLEIDQENLVAVVNLLPLQTNHNFYESISNVAKLADELEAKFWGVDIY